MKSTKKRKGYSRSWFLERLISGIILFLMTSVLVFETVNMAFGSICMVRGTVDEIIYVKYLRRSSRIKIIVDGDSYGIGSRARAERFQYTDDLLNALMTEVSPGEKVALYVYEGAFHGRSVQGLSCDGIEYLDLERGIQDNERFVLIFGSAAAICLAIGIVCEVQAAKMWKCIRKRSRRRKLHKTKRR